MAQWLILSTYIWLESATPVKSYSQASFGPFFVNRLSSAPPSGPYFLAPMVGLTLISCNDLILVDYLHIFFRNPVMKWYMSVVEWEDFFVLAFSWAEGSGRFSSFSLLCTVSKSLGPQKSENRTTFYNRINSCRITAPAFGSHLVSRSESKFRIRSLPLFSTLCEHNKQGKMNIVWIQMNIMMIIAAS